MNDEILKFMIGDAYGFRMTGGDDYHDAEYIELPSGNVVHISAIDGFPFQTDFYPLLLTRACEGLNIVIEQTGTTWGYTCRIHCDQSSITSSDLCAGSTPDEAKEAALTAVWEETP